MKFLIQTVNKKITHDFSFTLLESIKYNNWLNNSNDIKYKTIEYKDFNFKDFHKKYIPIGSVEFVCDFLKHFYNKVPKPKNVPKELFGFANRFIFNTDNTVMGDYFIKSNDVIKSHLNGIYGNDKTLISGSYQCSDIIEIKSEWRCFVYKNELVGLQNYSGDFTIFPDVDKINGIIKNYNNSSISYTLDVGINDTGTFIIEIHDFFSCGLYGFANYKILPYMFSRWFYEYLNSNK